MTRLNAKGIPLLDVTHNYVEEASIGEVRGWLHRKGANDACQDYSILPGSRGDESWLISPVADVNSLFSIAHGAGRKWARGECKGRLEKYYTWRELERSTIGSHVVCKDIRLLYQEAPEAYKPVKHIMNDMEGAGIARRIARFRPILTYKTRVKR